MIFSNRQNFIKTSAVLAAFLLSLNAFAQAHLSTQAHVSKVSSIATSETASGTDESFFTVDDNGFIVKWEDGLGEHFQVSDLQIKLIAKSPNSGNIAIYETDGYSIHRVSVIDWRTFTRKYSKIYYDTVTSLSYSEKGKYLMVGTAAVGGTFVYDAISGNRIFKATDVPGMITMIRTGESEKTAVMYSSTGSIIYYDLLNHKILNRNGTEYKMNAEKLLSQPVLFGTGDKNNCYIAGVKNNVVYVINAMTGKTIAQIPATSPYIFTSKSKTENGLYYLSLSGKTWNLQLVDNEQLKNVFEKTPSSTYNAVTPKLIKKITGLSTNSFTCAAKAQNTVILGSTSGDIYTLSDAEESETYTLSPITEKMYETIYDIDTENNKYYILTENNIYRTSYSDRKIELVAQNTGYKNLIKHNDSIILWTKDSRKSVQILDLNEENPSARTLFTPAGDIQNLRILDNQIVYIQGHASVSVYNMNTQEITEIYSGTSIEDAILINNTDLYIAKSKITSDDASLVAVNIITKETLPVKIENSHITYSLDFDYKAVVPVLYGIMLSDSASGEKVTTQIFTYNLTTKTVSTVDSLNEEDPQAFCTIKNNVVYTNIGNNQLRSYNTFSARKTSFRRSASIPQKVECSSDLLAVLNKDGSISWYNAGTQTLLHDWYLTVDGHWYEF